MTVDKIDNRSDVISVNVTVSAIIHSMDDGGEPQTGHVSFSALNLAIKELKTNFDEVLTL